MTNYDVSFRFKELYHDGKIAFSRVMPLIAKAEQPITAELTARAIKTADGRICAIIHLPLNKAYSVRAEIDNIPLTPAIIFDDYGYAVLPITAFIRAITHNAVLRLIGRSNT